MTCQQHVWPNHGRSWDFECLGAQGRVSVQTCNNCLAVNIRQRQDNWDGKQMTHTFTDTVVEPKP